MKKTEKQALLDDGLKYSKSRVYINRRGVEFIKIGWRFVNLSECFARYKRISIWF